ncbi:MAG: hypothetical protein R2939_19690, partial [Kofleriaceae bacterium]
NQKKLDALRAQQDAKATRDELRRASGMTDDAVLDQLVALGLRGNTVAALSLVPLIWVAWADGSIQENERETILQGAHGKGLERGTDGHALLTSWLAKRPEPGLFDAWRSYVKALASELNDEQNRKLKNEIVGFAKLIASVDGGFLGIRKVSAAEEKTLADIEATFDR